MVSLNRHYERLKPSYLFREIAVRVKEYQRANPGARLLRLGIGDVTRPLSPCVARAMEAASREMGDALGFRGYGPEQGYVFLREAISAYYKERGVDVPIEEIFVGDGAKSDIGNIPDIFGPDNTILIPDPVYPVYVDSNLMAGRRIEFIGGTWENGFLPAPQEIPSGVTGDVIYLCSPNNPTGAVFSRAQLKAWVDYANRNGSVILFDAAYETFVRDVSIPRSIYEIQGAKECAIEFCSLSKTAGFTGVRCGYTVVPEALRRGGASLRDMWLRQQTTKFNGVSYITQRGAEAAFRRQGCLEREADIAVYRENARLIADGLRAAGATLCGGDHSPYVWLKCGMPSWDFFDLLLKEAGVVGTPGVGFGENGEGCFRLTAFGTRADTEEAVGRIAEILK